VHQTGGFDTAAVAAGFGMGPHLTTVVVIAIGRLDTFAERERAPRTRLPLDALLLPTEPARSPVAA
jgi:hypothetical protein